MEQSKAKKSRRYFDQQFKIDAVRLASESGKSISEVARELGIGRTLLDRWKRALGKKGPAAAFPGNGNLSADKKEIEELRRELARVKEEREILEFILKVMGRQSSSQCATFSA
jgi:transposase-like protein